MSRKKTKDEKIENYVKEYQKQYCCSCKHTLVFNVKEKQKVCSWCGALNTNRTKGAFIYNFYKASKPEYKTIRIEGDLK